MTICVNCGAKITEGEKFCGNCGAPQKPEADKPKQGSLGCEPETAYVSGTYKQESLDSDHQKRDVAFEEAYQELKPKKDGNAGKSRSRRIVIGAVIIVAALLFLLKPSGWSTEDAQAATQAFLDYHFKGDTENYLKYMEDATEEKVSAQLDSWREELISSYFKSTVPVTDDLKAQYADFIIEFRKNARYTVGEAAKTEDGFEVPISVEPITSLAKGDFVLLDLQLNEDLPNADLNERVYARELELMKEQMENPSYGEVEEIVMHIAREDGSYVFSDDDWQVISDTYCVKDRHWTKERAKGAAEAVLGGVYEEKYAELAEWTFATKKEIEDVFSIPFSPEKQKEYIDGQAAELISKAELSDTYSTSDEIAQMASRADRSLLEGTQYEVVDMEGDEDEYVAKIRITPFEMNGLSETLQERIEEEFDSIQDIGKFVDRYYEVIAELIMDQVDNGRYDTPIYCDLHMKYNDNDSYELDQDELMNLYTIYSYSPEEEGDQSDTGEEGMDRDNEEKTADGDDKDEKALDSGSGHEDNVAENEANSGNVEYAPEDDPCVTVNDMKIEFGKTTLQEIMDKTGYSVASNINPADLSFDEDDVGYVDLDTGSESIVYTIHIDNRDKQDPADFKQFCVCGVELQTYIIIGERISSLLSAGGIRVGDKKEDVVKELGTPTTEGDGYVMYFYDDVTNNISFIYDDNEIVRAIIVSNLLYRTQ